MSVEPPAPPRAMLPVVLAATFVAALDFFIVNVAIPSMQADLGASAAAIEWVVAGYGLAYGSALITGGRLGDLLGRRRAWMLGMALFTLTSLVCGVAPSTGVLIAGRVAQGTAAALMAPQVLAILGTQLAGAARAHAISMYALTLGLASVFGQLLGGVLIQADVLGLGWRAVFLVNLPIGAVALLAAPRAIPDSRAPVRPRLDLVGAALATAALVAAVLPLVEGREQGWPLWTWLSFAAAAILLAAFVALQRRRSATPDGSPLVDLSLFRERAFSVGLGAQLVFWMGQASYFLVLALYLQQGRGLNPLQAGLAFLPVGGGYLATSLAVKPLAARLGRQVVAVGASLMIVGQVGLFAFVQSAGTGGSMALLCVPLLVDGLGMGLGIAPLAQTILSRVAPEHAGAASGVLSTTQQIGGALGVALVGIVFYGALGDGAPDVGHAFAMSLLALMGVAAAVIVLVQLLAPVPRPASAPAVARRAETEVVEA